VTANVVLVDFGAAAAHRDAPVCDQPVVVDDAPLCLTPPSASSIISPVCVSPFELEHSKRAEAKPVSAAGKEEAAQQQLRLERSPTSTLSPFNDEFDDEAELFAALPPSAGGADDAEYAAFVETLLA